MQLNVTMTPTQTFQPMSVAEVDNTNTPLVTPDPTYGAPVWTISDASMGSFSHAGINPAPTAFVPSGVLGTVTLTVTETSSDPTKDPIVGTVVITIVGPAAASLKPLGTVQGS